MRDYFTWGHLNKLVKTATKHKQVTQDQITTDIDFRPEVWGKRLVQNYNQDPSKQLFTHLFKMNKSHVIGMFVGLPFFVCANVLAPICIRAFQQYLQPAKFYECVFSENPPAGLLFGLREMSTKDGLNYAFGKLWPYLVIIGVAQLVRGFFDSFISYHSIQMGITMTSGLLDVLFNKMMVISETTKNVNAQGSLANILFTDTFKIYFFCKMQWVVVSVPLEVCVTVIYLGVLIDPSALFCLVSFLVLVPAIALLSQAMQKALSRMATIRDMRSTKIQEILNAVKIVKLFNTEKFQSKRIANCREDELRWVRKAAHAFEGHLTIGNTSISLFLIVMFGAMIGLNKFDVTKSFTMLQLTTYLQISVGFLPAMLMAVSDGLISIKRISAFFKLPEVDRSIIHQDEKYEKAI